MLVVDATTGQNALHQAVQFNEAVPLTGITLTKLDGTAKGGILFAIAERWRCRSGSSASASRSRTCATSTPTIPRTAGLDALTAP
jgi:hypothetical protein